MAASISGLARPDVASPAGGADAVAQRLARSDNEVPEPSPIVQRYPYLIPRATEDRPDVAVGSQVHVVYLVPSDANDEELDRLGMIEDSMRSQNGWLRTETVGLQWRLDAFQFQWDDPDGEVDPVTIEAVDVTFLRSTRPGSELNDAWEVQAELSAHRLDRPGKRYLSYVTSDAGVVCGDGFYSLLLPPTEAHDGKYAQVYLDSDPECGGRSFAPDASNPSYAEATTMHEILHNDTVVPVQAVHHCWGPFFLHVCTPGLVLTDLDPERIDLMFPFAGPPLSGLLLDRDHDDYFRHPFPYYRFEDSPYLERED